MKVNWLGQSGFVFESEGKRLLIDPFLSDIVEQKQGLKRLMQSPLSIEALQPDYIFITHNHLDHFDPIALPQIHQHYPNAIISGPTSVIEHAHELHFNKQVLSLMDKGSSLFLEPFKITATPAYHSDPFSTGIIVETENKVFYISGDTVFSEVLVNEIKELLPKKPDAVFIVINGKLGNMNVEEAVQMVKELQPALAIPMHYGMFAENTEDPFLFLNGCEAAGIKVALLQTGKEIDI